MRLGRGVGRTCQRLCLAHQRAQVGIFPFLDPPVRQTLFGEDVESRITPRRDRIVARQSIARLREGLSQRGFGRGLDDGDFRVHAGTSSRYCA
jgi:hypothetical protein